MVVIKPYEASQLKPIEDSIRNSDLGVNPTNDGNVIRVAIPQLTEERRRDLVKQAKAKGEDAKVSVRNVRRRAMEELHRIRKDGEAGEDEVGRAEKDLDKSTAHYVAQIDDLSSTRKANCSRSEDLHSERLWLTPTPAARPRGAGTPAKTSRAGRDLPAAIGVSLLLGGTIIAILLFAPRLWVALVAAGMAVATHEVVRRLRTAGYSIPVIPLLIGGQAMIWLTWPFGAAGALGGFGATVLVCLIWRLLGQGLQSQPVNYLRDVSVTVFIAAWIPLCRGFAVLLVYPDDGWARVFALMLAVTLLRYRWLYGRGAIRQAPHGAGDQPEEILGGFRGFADLSAPPVRCSRWSSSWISQPGSAFRWV